MFNSYVDDTSIIFINLCVLFTLLHYQTSSVGWSVLVYERFLSHDSAMNCRVEL